MAAVRFAFGKAGVDVSVPPGPQYHVIRGRSAFPMHNATQALEDALDKPHRVCSVAFSSDRQEVGGYLDM